MPSRTLNLTLVLFAVGLPAVSPSASAEMYRWIDERGVPNYSNHPPAKTSAVKDLTVIEDRLSVYTPDASTVEAVKRERERRSALNRSASYAAERGALPYAPVMAPPLATYDPCAVGDDVGCYSYSGYYATGPVLLTRPGSRRLVRSRVGPGLVAGNASGTHSFIAGLSTQTVPITSHHSSASFTLRAGRSHRSR